jgi:hypothetical protein
MDARLTQFNNFKRGVFISYSLFTFDYTFSKITNPNVFTPTNVDVDSWILKASNAGAKYAIYTCYDNKGFAMFDCPIKLPDYLTNSFECYRKYDVGVSPGDKLIVDKFFTACIKYGVEPMLYLCTWSSENIGARNEGKIYADLTTTQKQYWDNYYAKVLQYLMTNYGCKWFYLDMAGGGLPALADLQLYYDSIKSIDATAKLAILDYGDLTFGFFPSDIESNEAAGLSPNPGTKLYPYRTHNGTVYYQPQEYMISGIVNSDGSWYWKDGISTIRTPNTIFGANWDLCQTYSCNFNLGIAPHQDGSIDQTQLDLLKYSTGY